RSVEPKIIARRHVDFWVKEDKIPLRHNGFPTRELPFSPKDHSNTLVKIPKFSKHSFSLNSNFGIGGSSAKAPPIHRGRVRLLALT
ncbi:hypothetical protein DVH24_016782, partial [Malus domestica]